MTNIKQSQNDAVLHDFQNLYDEINYVCGQTGNYGLGLNYEIPSSVKLVYATEDPEDFETASDFVDTIFYSKGNNLCIVFKDETKPRCRKLDCDVIMPYMGSLDFQDDFQLLVNKILGKKLVKKYNIYIQNYADKVIVSKDRYVDFSQMNFDLNFNDYVILVIQLNGEIDNIEQKMNDIGFYWKEKTPLKSCDANVKVVKLPNLCPVPNQAGICNGDATTYYETIYKIMECASESNYFGIYDRIVGFVRGDKVCEINVDGTVYSVNGYSFGYGMPVVVASEVNYAEISIHELGHTYGLCDEGYGSGPDTRCESGYSMSGGSSCDAGDVCCPNKPEENSIYCTSNICERGCSYSFNFAPSSYKHLEENFKKYCD